MKRMLVILAVVACLLMTAVGIAQACKKEAGNPVAGYYAGEVGILGDINMDGKVDIVDLGMLGKAWGAHSGDPHYNECADLNSDGSINLTDQAMLGQQWTKTGFYTKGYPRTPGVPLPGVEPPPSEAGHLAWLQGIWLVDAGEGLITLDCEQVGVQCSTHSLYNSSRLRVLSPGDLIQSCYQYKDEYTVNINVTKTSTSVIWWSDRSPLHPLYESWMVMVKDNGDRHVKLEFFSSIGLINFSGAPGLATQIVDITW